MILVKKLSAIAGILSITACAAYQKDSQVSTLQGDIGVRTGYSIDRAHGDAAASPLTGKINYDDAVKSALKYNLGLQARLEQLNIAAADEVQAGLLINPSLEGEFVFTGGGARPLLDIMLALDVSRLLTRGKRRAAAKANRNAVQAEVTEAIINTIIRARHSVLNLWRAETMKQLYADQLTIAKAGKDTANLLYNAGNITDGMLTEYAGAYDLATIQHTKAKLAVLDAREALAAVTGTPLSNNVSASLTIANVNLVSEQSIFIEQALVSNIKLLSERKRIEALGARFKLAKVSAWLEHIELAAVYEREEDGVGEGFSVNVPLPIFDWGQVRTGRAQAMLDAASYRYKARFMNTRNRASALHQYVTSLKAASGQMSKAYIDNAENTFVFNESLLNAMQIGPLKLLTARSAFIQKQMQTVDIQYEYANAVLMADALTAGVSAEIPNKISMNNSITSTTGSEGAH